MARRSHLVALGLTLLALDPPTPIEEAADVDEGAAGAVEQVVDRADEPVRVGLGIPAPGGVKQLLFAGRGGSPG
jgi:hypothetical protein